MNELIIAAILIIVMGFLFYLFFKSGSKVKVYNKLPGKALTINPVDFKRSIVTDRISFVELENMLNQYSELVNIDSIEHVLRFKKNEWNIIISCDEDFPQIHFYNLISRFSEQGIVYGYCENLIKGNESFIARFDDNNQAGDTLIGLLSNGEKFFVNIEDQSAEITKNVSIGFNSLDEFKEYFSIKELSNSPEVESVTIKL